MEPAILETQRDGAEPVRFRLEPGAAAVLGRADGAQWLVLDEPHLSRRHVELRWDEARLKVRRLPSGKNPVFFRGEARDEFHLNEGEHFVIGATRFLWLRVAEAAPRPAAPEAEPAPGAQFTLSRSDVFEGGGADRMRLYDLMELPEILRTQEPAQFFLHIATLLRMATEARWATVEREDGTVLSRDSLVDKPGEMRSSRALKRAALASAPLPSVFCWSQGGKDLQATAVEGVDWAVCAAAKIPGEPALLFYAAGSGGDARAQRDNSRFVGLVADMVGRSLSVSKLQTAQGRMERFFSGPIIAKILASDDPKELEPKVTESTVLFFDIRGFSKRTEGQNQKILAYLGQMRRAMSAMTEEIFKEGGVVLQYLGDGILACWNVPYPDPRHVDQACRAALRMSARLPLATDGWRCGIGMHTGETVAGSLGSDQVFSYGLMGAVINQASRIEGITKVVEAPILVTREVAQKVSPETAVAQRVGRYQPAGMAAALDLYELSAPPAEPGRAEVLNRGLEALEKGDWEAAYEALDTRPAGDRPARYLKALAESYRRHPPKGWTGVIELSEK